MIKIITQNYYYFICVRELKDYSDYRRTIKPVSLIFCQKILKF